MARKSEKKRILFVVYELPPIGGGVATAASHLLKEFAKETNLIIDVVTSSVDNQWETEQFSDTISVYKIPIGQKQHRLKEQSITEVMVRFPLCSGIKIAQLLLQNKYDLVHYFGYPGGMLGLLHAWRVPYIVSLRGVDVPGYNQKFGWYYKLYKPLTKLVWKHARAVIANSQHLKQLALRTNPDLSIEVIPNGVNTELFKPVAESKKFKKFTVTAGGTVMGPKKGLEYLVEGFALFHKQHPDSELLLFGDGVLKPKLEAMVRELGIEQAVRFTGIVSHKELARSLPRCHVFCLPSLNEGMSNAMLEAMACGIAVISSDVGDAHSLLKKGGLILKNKSVPELAQLLFKLFSNRDKCALMGHHNRQQTQSLTWKNSVQRYTIAYENSYRKF